MIGGHLGKSPASEVSVRSFQRCHAGILLIYSRGGLPSLGVLKPSDTQREDVPVQDILSQGFQNPETLRVLAVRPVAPFAILAVTMVALLAPSFVAYVYAIGCTTNCYLTANTNVPLSEGPITVKLNTTTPTYYTLPHTFAFANGTTWTIQVMNLTLKGPSGTRYVWKQWAQCGAQAPSGTSPTLTTPRMLANYTTPCPSLFNGPFTAQFDIFPPAGCTTNCLLEAGTTIPSGEATVRIRVDNSTLYSIPQTFAFPNGTIHTIEVLSTALVGTSGARYVWKQWTYGGSQYSVAPMLRTPSMIYNYTTGSRGPFTAQFDKFYLATIRVVDGSSNPVSGATVTVTFSNSTSKVFTTDAQGWVQLGLIPPGSYTAQITYQNQDMGRWTADPSQTPAYTITVNAGGSTSAPVVSAIVLLTIFGVAFFLILLAIKVRKPPPPPTI